MAGFLTYYLFGMESCDMLSDNYIHEVIKRITMLFFWVFKGTICSPLILILYPSVDCLSYSFLTLRNQEYAAFFNNMLDTLSGMADQERDVCIAYMASYLCFLPLISLLHLYSFQGLAGSSGQVQFIPHDMSPSEG